MDTEVKKMYNAALARFGNLGWWPGETDFEIAVGAILTQNTAWTNVEKAILNLKAANVLAPERMRALDRGRLAELIRPAGYFNIKARRLGAFLDFLFGRYGGTFLNMADVSDARLRAELLEINGVGPETADSILLYALARPVFVVDAYTKRIFARHALLAEDDDYESVRTFFEASLGHAGLELYKDFHAQIVNIGKNFCRKKAPDCRRCPWNAFLPGAKTP